ncbi:unnamed protein product [Owenia fusiformis]|uniref:Uncharacterized protein n=1 Tax=Owenia fusiformis TaxID=6347 RepID=A0A8J1XJ91_OWEFU|nr:unnamed protein product [Owenia fusiformis]
MAAVNTAKQLPKTKVPMSMSTCFNYDLGGLEMRQRQSRQGKRIRGLHDKTELRFSKLAKFHSSRPIPAELLKATLTKGNEQIYDFVDIKEVHADNGSRFPQLCLTRSELEARLKLKLRKKYTSGASLDELMLIPDNDSQSSRKSKQASQKSGQHGSQKLRFREPKRLPNIIMERNEVRKQRKKRVKRPKESKRIHVNVESVDNELQGVAKVLPFLQSYNSFQNLYGDILKAPDQIKLPNLDVTDKQYPSNIKYPSKHGFHQRSFSPTYKRLTAAKDDLNFAVQRRLHEMNATFQRHQLQASQMTADEFYNSYLEQTGDDDLAAIETMQAFNNLAPWQGIPMTGPKPRLEFYLDKSIFHELHLFVPTMDPVETSYEWTTEYTSYYESSPTRRQSVWTSSTKYTRSRYDDDEADDDYEEEDEELDDESRKLIRQMTEVPPTPSPVPPPATTKPNEPSQFEKARSDLTGWNDELAKEDEELRKKMDAMKLKLGQSGAKDRWSKLAQINKEKSNDELEKMKAEKESIKESTTESTTSQLDNTLARLNNAATTTDALMAKLDKTFIDIAARKAKLDGMEEENKRELREKKRKIRKEKRLKELKEDKSLLKPKSMGSLMYSRYRKNNPGDKYNLNKEQAAEFNLTRDSKVITQRFIDKINAVAFGDADSDEESSYKGEFSLGTDSDTGDTSTITKKS